MKDKDKKAEADKRKETERELDEALEESFPASDPIQSTGTSAGAPDEHKAKTPVSKRQDHAEPRRPSGQPTASRGGQRR